MSRIAVLGNWHSLSNAAQYADALEALGHTVIRVGPDFTQEDAERWVKGLLEMEWPPTPTEAWEYGQKVYRESPNPVIRTEKGAIYDEALDVDAAIEFWSYGETPIWTEAKVRQHHAIVFGDTHTSHLQDQVAQVRNGHYDSVWVQFRRADLEAFNHHSKHWLPAAADPTIWRPYPEVERDIDVLFVGSTHPQVHRDRVELIRYLQANGINVVVKHAFGSDAAHLMARAKVVLNRSLAGDLNMRVPEAAACGAALVTDNVDGLWDTLGSYCFVPASDDPVYWTATIRNLLNWTAAREATGEGARRRVLERHTYEHRAHQLLSTMGLPEEGNGDRPIGDNAGEPYRGGGSERVGFRVSPEYPAPHRRGSVIGSAHGGILDGEGVSLTIIIPVYNHWEDCTWPLLGRLANDLSVDGKAEILVVDDGSNDGTKNTHQTLGAHILHKPNGGFASAANYGVKHAKGEYVVVLNNDTQPEEGWLAPLLDELRNGAGIVGSQILNMDGTIQANGLEQRVDGSWHNTTYAGITWLGSDVMRGVPAVMGACFAMRRDTFLRLGGLDEGFKNGCEDVDLCLRARQEGLPVRLRLDSKVRHAEGSTRFHVPGIQEHIARNQTRLLERWGTPDVRTRDADSSGGSVPDSGPRRGANDRGDDGGGEGSRRATGLLVQEDASGAGGETGRKAERVLTIALQGHLDVATGGSLAVINGELKDRLPASGIAVHDYFVPGYVGIQMDLGREQRDGKPQLLLSHYFTPDGWQEPPAHIPHWAAICPWEYPPAITDFPDGWKRVAENKRLERIFTPSEWSRSLLTPLFGAERITVIPNGTDTQTFSPDGPKAEGRDDLWRLLYVGGMIHRKGVDRLYEAWRLAFPIEESAKAILILKGQGASTFYANQSIFPPEDFTRPNGVFPTCSRIDRDMDATELAGIYRKCDALVAPFRWEGFCMPVLEAMACGLPVVTSDHLPVTEFLPDGAGLKVPSVNHEVDVTSLARAIRYLYEHREDGKAMGKIGHEAAQAFAWSRIAEKYAAEIRKVCGA